ncbi:MAG TPA: hypothetical protein VIC26_07535 [Marinagarivorans sp.]
MKRPIDNPITRLVGCIFFGFAFSGTAYASKYQPAEFADALAHLQQSVSAPQLSADLPVVGVYCQADVDVSGITSDVRCYEKEGFDELRQQTEQAMSGRNFTPATVDGNPVPVRMVFRVVYSEIEGQQPILLLPNLGNMQKRLGAGYIAPQERLDVPQWYAKYQAGGGEGRNFFASKGPLTRVIAHVDEEGKVAGVRRIEAHGRYRSDAVILEKALPDARFIPGVAKGKPQQMQYVAVLNYAN